VEKDEQIDVTTLIVLDVSTGVPEMPTEPTPPVGDTTQPTDPKPSQPTEPEPTPPEDGMETIDYAFTLPSRTESYELKIMLGGELYTSMTIQPGATTAIVPLTGTGTKTYQLLIDDEPYDEVTVEFEPDD
jgi:hypothetical protein